MRVSKGQDDISCSRFADFHLRNIQDRVYRWDVIFDPRERLMDSGGRSPAQADNHSHRTNCCACTRARGSQERFTAFEDSTRGTCA